MYNLGLVSVSFRAHTPEEILQAMVQNGLGCIEWGSDVHCPPAAAEKIARLQADHGVVCCSYGTYFRLGVTPVEELPGYIEAAKILGAPILRLWCGSKNSEEYTEREREALFCQCREAAAMAEKAGVVLCMECHGGTFTNRKEAALELMKAVNSSAFRMYWQPNQFRTAEENLAYASLLAPYTAHLHVFHWREKEKLPLSGAVDVWKSYLGCFRGDRHLLLEFMPDDRLESLPAEVAALKEIAG